MFYIVLYKLVKINSKNEKGNKVHLFEVITKIQYIWKLH